MILKKSLTKKQKLAKLGQTIDNAFASSLFVYLKITKAVCKT